MMTTVQVNASALQSDLAQSFAADHMAACHQWSALEWHERVAGEEAERDAAMNRVRAIAARGGRVTVSLAQTPVRTVVLEEVHSASGDSESIQAVGEIWG